MGWSGLWAWIGTLLSGMARSAVDEGRVRRIDAAAQRLAGGDGVRAGDVGVEDGGAARADGALAARRDAMSLGLQAIRDARAGVRAGAGLPAAQFRQVARFHRNGQRRDADLRPHPAHSLVGALVLGMAGDVSRRFRVSQEAEDHEPGHWEWPGN